MPFSVMNEKCRGPWSGLNFPIRVTSKFLSILRIARIQSIVCRFFCIRSISVFSLLSGTRRMRMPRFAFGTEVELTNFPCFTFPKAPRKLLDFWSMICYDFELA